MRARETISKVALALSLSGVAAFYGCGGVEDGGLFGVSVGPPLGIAGGAGSDGGDSGNSVDPATSGTDGDGAAASSDAGSHPSKPSAPAPDANKDKGSGTKGSGNQGGNGGVDPTGTPPEHPDKPTEAADAGPTMSPSSCDNLAACCATLKDPVQHQCDLMVSRGDVPGCTAFLRGLCSGDGERESDAGATHDDGGSHDGGAANPKLD